MAWSVGLAAEIRREFYSAQKKGRGTFERVASEPPKLELLASRSEVRRRHVALPNAALRVVRVLKPKQEDSPMPTTIIQTLRRSLTEYDVGDLERPSSVLLRRKTFDKLVKELTGEVAVGRQHLKGTSYDVAAGIVMIDGVLFADEDA